MKLHSLLLRGLVLLQTCRMPAFSQTVTVQPAAPKDIVINEILSHARPNAFDYIEYYNASNKIFDASRLLITNRKSTGAIGTVKKLSSKSFYIYPGDYIVATEDSASLVLNYLVQHPNHILTVTTMPSTPNDEGYVLLLNADSTIIDEVDYSSDWQYKLIASDVGVALERIDPAGPSQDPNNWHSASSTSGYGTPTYQNSQYKKINAVNATIAITPSVFSPDNDGRDDVATIHYSLNDPGYVANITIFNAIGRPVRYLAKNAILGLTGYWNWDGLDEQGAALPIGPYIVLTEIFNLQGKKQQFKNALVLARVLK